MTRLQRLNDRVTAATDQVHGQLAEAWLKSLELTAGHWSIASENPPTGKAQTDAMDLLEMCRSDMEAAER